MYPVGRLFLDISKKLHEDPEKTQAIFPKKLNTVRLGKMAQHARLWALFMAKLKGQSQNASNMALGQLLGLQHIQKSAS